MARAIRQRIRKLTCSTTIALLALVMFVPTAAAADDDNDGVPDEVEQLACAGDPGLPGGNQLVQCKDGDLSTAGGMPPMIEDGDQDGIPDLVEATLCYYNNPSGPLAELDGDCSGNDYSPPSLDDVLRVLCSGMNECDADLQYTVSPRLCTNGCTSTQDFRMLSEDELIGSTPAAYVIRCTLQPINFPYVTVSEEQSCPPGSTYDSTVHAVEPVDVHRPGIDGAELLSLAQGTCEVDVQANVFGFGHNPHTYAFPCAFPA